MFFQLSLSVMLQDRINALMLEVTAGPFKEVYDWIFFTTGREI